MGSSICTLHHHWAAPSALHLHAAPIARRLSGRHRCPNQTHAALDRGLLLCAAAATASETASDVAIRRPVRRTGKTCGGGTIAAELRNHARAVHEVHLDKVDTETLAKYKRVIVTGARPVDRVVSAFNWRSPHACRQRKGECTPPRSIEKFDGERGLYNCFPDVQHFVDVVTER